MLHWLPGGRIGCEYNLDGQADCSDTRISLTVSELA